MTAPKLRFTGFDESWSEVILDDLAEVERGKFSVRPRNDPRYFGGKMPFVQTGDVTGSDVYLKGFSQTLNEDGIKVSKVFPEDTILITIAANIGDTTITQYPVACPDSVVAIQPKKELTNTIFLKNVIDLQKDFLDSQATQNAQKNINLQVLKPLELIVPSLKEQTKIAAFLSAVDEKISQLTQKYELLSQYKQGMMQKLFSQEIRFKADDGSEFGEWENGCLGDITAIQGGYAFKSNSFGKGATKVLRIGDIRNNIFLDCFNGVYSEEIPDARYVVSKDAIVMALSGATFGKLGKVVTGSAYLNQRVATFKVNEKTTNEYVYQVMLSKDFFNYIQSIPSASAQPNISNQDVINFEILIPCLEEQTKIANFLSAIDQKIEVVAQQIEQAKQWKKGLLQQMFI